MPLAAGSQHQGPELFAQRFMKVPGKTPAEVVQRDQFHDVRQIAP
jgi:hypothetical protein